MLKRFSFIILTASIITSSHLAANAPSSVGAIGSASGSESSEQRLRASHVKDLAVTREAETLFEFFENLALETAVAEKKDLKDIWTSAEKVFKLEEDNAEAALKVVQYYEKIFVLNKKLQDQEEALIALGEREKGNKTKNKTIKKQKNRVRNTREKISDYKDDIQDEIKSIIEYDDKGLQRQALDNWLVVSTGMLRDIRDEKASTNKKGEE